jgi:hypothetical protein
MSDSSSGSHQQGSPAAKKKDLVKYAGSGQTSDAAAMVPSNVPPGQVKLHRPSGANQIQENFDKRDNL